MEVQELLHIDRSTVYRIAEGERLPSIRVGRTWRFPADKIAALLTAGPDAPLATTAANPVAQTTIEVAVAQLGVMIVVTDMNGQPVTGVVNPCPWPSKSCAPIAARRLQREERNGHDTASTNCWRFPHQVAVPVFPKKPTGKMACIAGLPTQASFV